MKLVLALVLCFALTQAVPRSKKLKPRDILIPEKSLKTRRPAKTTGASNSTSRIIGGEPAKDGQFPWQVSITMDDAYFCGGSVISPNTVLTAGHCVEGTTSFVLVFGSLDPDGVAGSVTQTSRNGILHEKYDSQNFKNDIGLVKLATALTFNTQISSIALPAYSQASHTFAGENATIAGWGRTSDSANSISSTLKSVVLKVINNTVCAQTYGTGITAGNICTSTDSTRATCNGDSGGPLVFQGADGKNIAIGIVSFGSSSGCEKGYPDAFTRVTAFLDWIDKNSDVKIDK